MAIGISALIIVTLVSLTSNALQNAQFSKNESSASAYAQQAIEWLRNQRDANVGRFEINVTPLLNTTDCFNNLGFGAPGPCQSGSSVSDTNGNPTPFTRVITFTHVTGTTKNIIETDVTVSWKDSKGTHSITSGTYFADWRQR